MSDVGENLNVFGAVSKSEWVKKVEGDLKGKPLEGLRSITASGVMLEPLYMAEDVTATSVVGVPGGVPFCRGASTTGDWIIRQEYDDRRPDVCGCAIAKDRECGVEGLWVRLGPRYGCRVRSVADLETLFDSVDLTETSICLEGVADTLSVAAGWFVLARRRNIALKLLHGGLGFDPLGILVSDGTLDGGLHARLSELCDLASWCTKHAPSLRAVCVDANVYEEAGASVVQELAWSIAMGVEYLRQLVDVGLGVDDAAQQLLFRFSISGEFFVQVAKLRAARWLWSKIVLASGGREASAAMQMHCKTSVSTKTRREPWVNVLRSTAECTAAVLGGAQSVTTLALDAADGSSSSELGHKIARNVQNVLREEVHLGKVVDPAGGSWFVESMTEQIARAAWKQFQQIERAGGFVEVFLSGALGKQLQEVVDVRRRDLASRENAVLGVSEFVNFEESNAPAQSACEEPFEDASEGWSGSSGGDDGHRDELLKILDAARQKGRGTGQLTEACIDAVQAGHRLDDLAGALSYDQPDFYIPPMSGWRLASMWEKLQARSDREVHSGGERPKACLVNLGDFSSYKARSSWTTDLLAAAGIQALDVKGASSVVEACKKTGPKLAVVCGSDADYAKSLESTVSALKEAGCGCILVTGRPKEQEASLRRAGVSDFLYRGADVFAILKRTLDTLIVQ